MGGLNLEGDDWRDDWEGDIGGAYSEGRLGGCLGGLFLEGDNLRVARGRIMFVGSDVFDDVFDDLGDA